MAIKKSKPVSHESPAPVAEVKTSGSGLSPEDTLRHFASTLKVELQEMSCGENFATGSFIKSDKKTTIIVKQNKVG